MANLNRVYQVVEGNDRRASGLAAKSGLIVIHGGMPRQAVSAGAIRRSGLKLVPPGPSKTSSGSPARLVAMGSVPSWLKAMWVGSILASGWALYWVSLGA